MNPRKTAGIGLAIASLVVVGWLGSSAFIGSRLETSLRELKEAQSNKTSGYRLTNLEHSRGLMTSNGKVDVELDSGCAGQESDDDPLTLHVTYSLSHLPLPSGAARFEWQMAPNKSAADLFKKLFGEEAKLSGAGHVSTSGLVRTDLRFPALHMRRGGESLRSSASSGFLEVVDKRLAFGWKTDRLVMRDTTDAVEVRDFEASVNLSDRYLDTGTATFSSSGISTKDGSAEGITLNYKAVESDGRLDMTLAPAINKLEVEGQSFSNMTLSLQIKGIDAKSYQTVSTTFSESCGVGALTALEDRKIKEALQTILLRGLSLGIPRMTATSEKGTVSAEAALELLPAKGEQITLLQQLKFKGNLDVGDGVLNPEQVENAIAKGVFREIDKGIRADLEYSNGLLRVNGRIQEAGEIRTALGELDQGVQVALSGDGKKTRPPEANPPTDRTVARPEPQQSETPGAQPEPLPRAEQMPTVAAASTCSSAAECTAASIKAAQEGDLNTVRSLADQMDSLPKPSLGNKVLGRKLNAEALAALEAQDNETAVRLLAAAYRENPRDVEVVGNLGYALVQVNRLDKAVAVLAEGLVLDPRRTATWTPLAEALALHGKGEHARATMWIGYQWSKDRAKSIAYYQQRLMTETRPQLRDLYAFIAKVAERDVAR